jgi:hypothetical protein
MPVFRAVYAIYSSIQEVWKKTWRTLFLRCMEVSLPIRITTDEKGTAQSLRTYT